MLVFIYSGRCFSHLYKVDTKSFFIHLSCLCRSTPHQPSQDHDHCPVVHLCAFCSDELWRGFWFVKQDQTTMTIALLYCWAELWLDLLVGSRSWCRDIDSGVWSQECWWHYYSWKPIHYAKCRHCPPRPQWRCSRCLSVSPSCAWVLGRGYTLAEKSLWHRNHHRYRVSHITGPTLFSLFSRVLEHIQSNFSKPLDSPQNFDSETHLTFHFTWKIDQVTAQNVRQTGFWS